MKRTREGQTNEGESCRRADKTGNFTGHVRPYHTAGRTEMEILISMSARIAQPGGQKWKFS